MLKKFLGIEPKNCKEATEAKDAISRMAAELSKIEELEPLKIRTIKAKLKAEA